MPRRPTKRQGSGYDSDDSVDLVRKRTKRAPRKASTAQTKRGEGKAAKGTKVTTDAATTRKRKDGVSNVKEQIQKQGDDLVGFIETQLKERPIKREALAVEKLAPTLAPVLPWMTSPTTSSRSAAGSPLPTHEKALDELLAVIESYDQLNAQSTGIKKQSWMRWDQDGKELNELNEHAVGFAACNVSFAVMPGLRGSPAEPPASAGDVQKMAWELVEEGRPKKGEVTWGAAAQGQVKAFTEVLKMLPSEK